MKEIKQLDKLGKDLNVVYVPVTELKFSEYNPRLWPEKTIKDLKKSIQMNGFMFFM